MKTCSIDWCENPHKANGFCAAHNRRNDRGTDMNKPLRTVIRSKMGMEKRKHGVGAYRDGCRCDICYEENSIAGIERRTKIYMIVAKIKLERGCMDCGYNLYSCALEFDHRPGEVKELTVGSSAGSASLDRILAEIEKCDVVCGNCHQVRSQQRVGGFILTLKDLEGLND